MKQISLNRDTIKYFAMFTMLLNHIAKIFIGDSSLLGRFMLGLGYFTAITMCYFLVEGYRYTRSVRKYLLRLGIFAVISQVPFMFAFSKGRSLEFYDFNMICTLFFCLLICIVWYQCTNESLKMLLIIALTVATVKCDWPVYAAFYTVMFLQAGTKKEKQKQAFAVNLLFFLAVVAISDFHKYPVLTGIEFTLLDLCGPLLSAVLILCFYNGERAQTHRNFHKWFFYLFYPVHLTILGIVRLLCS